MIMQEVNANLTYKELNVIKEVKLKAGVPFSEVVSLSGMIPTSIYIPTNFPSGLITFYLSTSNKLSLSPLNFFELYSTDGTNPLTIQASSQPKGQIVPLIPWYFINYPYMVIRPATVPVSDVSFYITFQPLTQTTVTGSVRPNQS
jgi:hypothetical protein